MILKLWCVSVLAAGWGVSHAKHDVSPRFGTTDGPPGPRKWGSNAEPVEATHDRSASIPQRDGKSSLIFDSSRHLEYGSGNVLIEGY